jgi:hypothetical protein
MMRKHVLVTVAVVLALAGVRQTAAQDQRADRSDSPAVATDQVAARAAQEAAIVPSAYGTTSYSIMQIPAPAFTPRHSPSVFHYAGSGYTYYSSNGSGDTDIAWAPVILPTGTAVYYLDFYAYDADATYDMSATLRRFYSTSSLQDIVSATTSGSAGYGYFIGDITSTPHTIDNNRRWGTGANYTVVINIPNPTSALAFSGVDLWTKRQVSTGPATATFADVPTSSPYFKFVEALSAAGIVTGCGSGNYCPSGTVTRGQMAVFLASSLGMHWEF